MTSKLFYSLFSVTLLLSGLAHGECPTSQIIANEYIVRLKKQDRSIPALYSQAVNFLNQSVQKNLGTSVIFSPSTTGKEDVSVLSLEKIPPTTLSIKTSSPDDFNFLKTHPEVESVEPNCRVQTFLTTNDSQFNKQWGLTKIQAPQAWDISRGSKNIIISISDTGVDYLHEDLKDNMWVNTKEIPGNKIDDDGNGCVDDIYGCDFASNTGDPMPTNSNLLHGTHVAGIAAASGNNGIGVSGVSQNIRILAAKGFSSNGSGSTDALLKTIYYSVQNGARVINCSWGHEGASLQAELDAFRYAVDQGVVVVVAAGNSNKDASTFSPAGIPEVITVAATDTTDEIATFSNWGTVIDIAAPGGKGYNSNRKMVDGIFATLPRSDGSYGELIGTSMAAPFVTGLAGLVLSVNPKLTPAEVLRILKDGGDEINVTTSGSGKKFTYKRINAFKALQLAQASLPPGGGTGSDCTPGAAECSSSGDSPMPPSMKSALTPQASGCALVKSTDDSGPQGPGALALIMALPLLVVFGLRLHQKRA